MDHPFAGTELETFLASGIENLLLYIKKTPNNTIVADLLIYAAIVYGILLLVRCTSKVRWCKKITHFLFPRGIMQFLLNLVQTLSIIITIVFSNNIMNILKLEEAEKKLGAVQKELEEKKKERDEIQQELEDNKKMLEMKTREYNKVQAVSRELARTNRGIEKKLNDSIIEVCFNSIYLQALSYFVMSLRQIDEYMLKNDKSLSISEVATLLKEKFGIKKETMLTSILDYLHETTPEQHYKEMYARIKSVIRNDKELQSIVVDIDAFVEEFITRLKKESFSPFFTEKNLVKHRKITEDVTQKYIGASCASIKEYISNLQHSLTPQ